MREVPLFQGIKDNMEALRELANLMEETQSEAGDEFIHEGDEGDRFFILLSGQVVIKKSILNGEPYTVAVLDDQVHPGLGEGGLIDSEVRSATVSCKTDCSFLILTQKNFTYFCEKWPQWALPITTKLASILMQRLKKTNQDLALLYKALMNEIRG